MDNKNNFLEPRAIKRSVYHASRRQLLVNATRGMAAVAMAALGSNLVRAGTESFVQQPQNMSKLIILLWRKPGLSRQEFMDYYEQHHAPLARQLVPEIAAADYRRNYVGSTVSYMEDVEFFDFDVITEIGFASHADYEKAMTTLAEPQVSERIVRDEENFIDRSKIQPFVVTTCSS